MEVQIVVPAGTDISVIEKEYPDIYQDDENNDGVDTYFIGNPGREWLEYEEAIECCGFIEGAIQGADTLIEGNGAWAQGMLSRKDFSGFSVSTEDIAEYKRCSKLWWDANARGSLATKR